MRRLRIAVIDLDGTLAATERAYARALRVLAGLGVAPADFAAAHRRWWAVYETGGCTIEEMYRGRMSDCGLTGEPAREANDLYVQATATVRLRPGARALLSTLRRSGVATVVLTNGGSAGQRRKIARLGLDGLVDAVLVSEEIGHAKPATAAFQAALDAARGRAEGAVMIGDDLNADVAGSLQAGFARAVWVTTARRPVPDPRVVVVRRLDQVAAALRLPRG